ncbi:MAG: sugar ABC transporter permease, partial [Cyanobacteria bacterium J06633_2]
MSPALVILGLTVFWPSIQALYLSFTEYGYDITQSPQWVGTQNFQRLFTDDVFWKTLGNTLLYLLVAVPILVIVPLGLAILVNQSLPGIRWFRATYYAPVVISMVVAGIAWRWLYAENGLLNQLLNGLRLSEEGIPWLTSPNIALFSVMAVTVWKGLGYYMVIYLAGLQAIPAELYEAASIDGSDGWLKHLDITIPLMRPYLFLVAVISSISATKVFEEIYIMTRGGPANSTSVLAQLMYIQAFNNYKMGEGAATAVVLFLISFVFIVI